MAPVVALGGLAISAVLTVWTLVLIARGVEVSYLGSPLSDAAFSLSFLAYSVVGAPLPAAGDGVDLRGDRRLHVRGAAGEPLRHERALHRAR